MECLFIKNKYTTWYYNIVNNAKSRTLKRYSEQHHIIPRSLGGNDNNDNLVRLTPKEHYVCHALLPKMLEGVARYKMLCAFNMMHVGHDGRRYTSQLYEYYKIKFYKEHRKRMQGHKRSSESRLKQSLKTRGKPWSEKARQVKRNKPTAKPVLVYKKDSKEFVGQWESISLCAKDLNIDVTTVWKICANKPSRPAPNGKVYPMRSHKGYTFKYKD